MIVVPRPRPGAPLDEAKRPKSRTRTLSERSSCSRISTLTSPAYAVRRRHARLRSNRPLRRRASRRSAWTRRAAAPPSRARSSPRRSRSSSGRAGKTRRKREIGTASSRTASSATSSVRDESTPERGDQRVAGLRRRRVGECARPRERDDPVRRPADPPGARSGHPSRGQQRADRKNGRRLRPSVVPAGRRAEASSRRRASSSRRKARREGSEGGPPRRTRTRRSSDRARRSKPLRSPSSRFAPGNRRAW